MPRAIFCTLLLLPCLTLFLTAEEAKKPPSKKTASEPWTVDDVIMGETASEWQISPDGRFAVWVKSIPDREKNGLVGHLMLSNLKDASNVQLTRGGESCLQPRWSPDGRRLAFLSSRSAPKSKHARAADAEEESKAQIWLLYPFGGEPWVLTEAPRDIRAFAWADGDTILYLAQEKAAHRETKLKDDKDSVQVVEDEMNEPPVRLWRYAIKEKKTTRLTDNKDRIQALYLSPNGRYAVTVHERSLSFTFDNKVKPIVFLHDLQQQCQLQIFTEKHFNIGAVHWQPDSQSFYAINNFTTSPRYLMTWIGEVHHCDIAGRAQKVDLDWERGVADGENGFAVLPDGFLTLLANGVRHKLARYRREGMKWKRDWLRPENIFTLTGDRAGKTVIYQEGSAQAPPRWLRAKLNGTKLKNALLLADLQGELRQRKRAKVETIRWQGAREKEVEGLLYYPHDYKKGQKYPLVVMIHGGPFGADFDWWDESWAYTPNLICQRGAFVLKPNYHGSSNYGLEWAESIANGKYYEHPVLDIEKGIDHLAARGLVDASKVGLNGWSNGAILTMALITRRHYQAAAAGAGGSEWIADWGACEFGMAFSNYYLGKSPLEDPQTYFKLAPFFQLPKVKTPVILFQGSEDRVVPAHHGWMQFRALQQSGKTVRFLLFPGERHSLHKLSFQRRKVEEELAWFDQHLFRTLKRENPALKEDSPLQLALALGQAARSASLYGQRTKSGQLIPEVVEYQGLKLGRFEVTRAQYAEFDPHSPIERGTENYPANNITFVKARAYCAWLSKVTGTEYRLGTVKELEEIYEEADGTENTLDHWAGYEVNPEDRERLQEKIRALPGRAPLLQEVGRFKPLSKKAPLYDLGGNVAEWAIGELGREVLLGGSADRTSDERDGRRGRAAPEYVGFRVVQGPPGGAKKE